MRFDSREIRALLDKQAKRARSNLVCECVTTITTKRLDPFKNILRTGFWAENLGRFEMVVILNIYETII